MQSENLAMSYDEPEGLRGPKRAQLTHNQKAVLGELYEQQRWHCFAPPSRRLSGRKRANALKALLVKGMIDIAGQVTPCGASYASRFRFF